MPFACLEVPDVRSRGLDAPGDLLLSQVQLPSPFPNDLTERSFFAFSHRLPIRLIHSAGLINCALEERSSASLSAADGTPHGQPANLSSPRLF
jgi:hypothetical protein